MLLDIKHQRIVGIRETDYVKGLVRKLGIQGLDYPRFLKPEYQDNWVEYLKTQTVQDLHNVPNNHVFIALGFISHLRALGDDPCRPMHQIKFKDFTKALVEPILDQHKNMLQTRMDLIGLRSLKILRHKLTKICPLSTNQLINTYIGIALVGTMELVAKDRKEGVDPLLFKNKVLLDNQGISLEKISARPMGANKLFSALDTEIFVRYKKDQGQSIYLAKSKEKTLIIRYIMYVDQPVFLGQEKRSVTRTLELLWNKRVH